jgi:hypothetical protein
MNSSVQPKKTRKQKRKEKLLQRQKQVPQAPKVRKAQVKLQQKKKQEMVKNGLGQTRKQARADPRLGKTGIKMVDVVANAQGAITYNVNLQPINLVSFAIGYVTRALEKGWAGEATSPWDPYFALQYLVNLLLQYSSNAEPPTLQQPLVVLAVARSLTTKEVPFGNGLISYVFNNISQAPPQVNIPVGYSGYGFQWTSGWVVESPTMTNTFPNITTTGAPPYTDVAGAAAFSNMNIFLAPNLLESPDLKLVPMNTKTPFDREVSPYAIVSQQQGIGIAGVGSGGFGVQSQLEVPIFRPLLTLINAVHTAEVEAYPRYPNLTASTAGDACVLGAYLGRLIPLKNAGMKRPLKFHCIDFIEFLEVSSLWLQAIIQAAMNDSGGQFSAELPPADYTLPITQQEFGMLLRNCMMDAFKNTQAGVQGLYPEVPSSGTDNQFVPFVASSGTCFLQTVPMQLPSPLVENIRALVYRETWRSKTDCELFIPVLGQYANDALTSTDYTYTYSGVTYPVFTPPADAGIKRKIWDPKTETFKTELGAETTISYIDGSASGTLVAINNVNALKQIQGFYDEWLGQTGIATWSAQLVPLSTENGINVLYSGNMTRHWIPAPPSYQTARQLTVRRTRKAKLSLDASPYSTRLYFADTAQVQPLNSAYTQAQAVWILPIVEQEADTGTLPNISSTFVTRWQALMNEPYLMASTSGYDGASMTAMHQSYAAKMVRGRQQPTNNWEQFFSDMAKTGRGGILSSLVGGALSSFFPQAAGVINTVADLVPF